MWKWKKFLDKNCAALIDHQLSPLVFISLAHVQVFLRVQTAEKCHRPLNNRVDGVDVGFGNVVQHQNKKL